MNISNSFAHWCLLLFLPVLRSFNLGSVHGLLLEKDTDSEEIQIQLLRSRSSTGSSTSSSSFISVESPPPIKHDPSPDIELLQESLQKHKIDMSDFDSYFHSDKSKCDPETDVDLFEFPQWRDEVGYWIGEYTFLQGDGSPFQSLNWPYPYNSYKGFITGNISGNKYRQRNVFLYPPSPPSACGFESDTVGKGVCGVNGNTKVFQADQEATTCTVDGSISGPYPPFFQTKTELVGANNALLYQVILPKGDYGPYLKVSEDRVFQSQLTTITGSATEEYEQTYRTRTAQGFNAFHPTDYGVSNSASYYRERKVATKEEFMQELQDAIVQYSILSEDLCKWNNIGKKILETGSLKVCEEHLDESFQDPFIVDTSLSVKQ